MMYVIRRVLNQVNISLTWIIKTESHGASSIPRPESIYRPKTSWMRGRPGPLEGRPCYTVDIYAVNLSLSLSPRWCTLGRGNRPFRDYWTELTLIPRPNVTVRPQAEQGLMEVIWGFSSTVGPFPQHSVQADGAGSALLLGSPAGCCPPSVTFVFPGPSSQEEAGLPKTVHTHTPQPSWLQVFNPVLYAVPSSPWDRVLQNGMLSFSSTLPLLMLFPAPGICFWLPSLELHGACF